MTHLHTIYILSSYNHPHLSKYDIYIIMIHWYASVVLVVCGNVHSVNCNLFSKMNGMVDQGHAGTSVDGATACMIDYLTMDAILLCG
jgi:hypothetical protein